MTFSTYYDSNDAGLGGVANTAGSLIAFLDKVLVNGYNSQVVTSVTSAGLVATVTLTAHGFRERQFITISGATPAGYNLTAQIIAGSVTANTFQYAIAGALSSPATGTISAVVAPLGWTKAFTGTNLAAYKQATGNQLYLRVDDTGTTSARTVGYEAMTDVNTGTNPFPTAVQVAGGLTWSKSSGVARRCILWGNGKIFWFFTDYAGDSTTGIISAFGDITSYKSADAWATMHMSGTAAGTDEGYIQNVAATAVYSAIVGHFMARSYTQIAGAVTLNKIGDTRFSVAGASGQNSIGSASGAFTYPAPVDGNLWTTQLIVNEITAQTPRGLMPGAYAPLHNRALTNYVIFTGAGALAGKEFMAINGGAGTGQILAEVSNTF